MYFKKNYYWLSENYYISEFHLAIGSDSLRTNMDHGILEIRDNGIHGRICMHEFTDVEASVACKSLGYKGKWLKSYLSLVEMPTSLAILQSLKAWEASQCNEFGVCCLLQQYDFL